MGWVQRRACQIGRLLDRAIQLHMSSSGLAPLWASGTTGQHFQGNKMSYS